MKNDANILNEDGSLSKNTKDILLSQMKNELTEAEVYRRLVRFERNPDNRKILEGISADEIAHSQILSSIIPQRVKPSALKILFIVSCARLFGLTFVLKLMERGENDASKCYHAISEVYPQITLIANDEERHESELIGMLNDERLNNTGAIVLGLNDALVELTGALAGFTFALGDPVKIVKLGMITGFAAAMSMAASAFLSARAASDAENGVGDSGDADTKGALSAALHTGIAYIITVLLLVSPYALLKNATMALIVMLLLAFAIIASFNFYLSVARDKSFKRGFFLMAGISTLVALISYGFGYLLR